jgi:multisubunit Na+/H+ antiporter MnhE subunit
VSGGLVRAAAIRFAGFALVWMVLTGGSLYGWPVALATLFAATAASLALVPPGRWSVSPIGVARFVPFFLGYSARAGVDVALRAFRSKMPIRRASPPSTRASRPAPRVPSSRRSYRCSPVPSA